MKIKQFEVRGLAQYSYVISSSGRAVVIDPIRDLDRYMSYAAEHGLAITHVLETHIHADYASGAPALAEATGAELALSAYDDGAIYRYAMQHRRLADGDIVEAGKLKLRALHTPGHTPEHLSFVLFDPCRSATEPVALFSGDFLFAGSLGRPDLLGDDAKVQLAHELYRSLHERIAHLPDGVQVYPGHGAGSFCGTGMSERAESTLGYERATQPLFQLPKGDFVEQIFASVPPMPAYYPRMKRLNAAGAPSVQPLPGAQALSTERLADMLAQNEITVLDLRRPEAFGGAHIENAINVGAGPGLPLWAGWLLDPEKPLVLVTDSDDDDESRRALTRVGLDRIAGSLAGGMPAWIEAGLPFTHTPQLSVCETQRRLDEVLILDVRTAGEWNGGHIAGARHIMLGDLPCQLANLPKDRAIVVVCGSGYRSSIAASLLQNHGFEDVSSMHGGMSAWTRQQLPVVTN